MGGMTFIDDRWAGMHLGSWSSLDRVADCLAAGADPDSLVPDGGRPLHLAAEWGSTEVVGALVARTRDIDALDEGRTALWNAVHNGRSDIVRILKEAGADPWRPMMAGWSPGRLNLASRTPDLFAVPTGMPGLSPSESAAVAEAHRLIGALTNRFHHDGFSLSCVGGIDAAEAVRRLEASIVEHDDPESMVQRLWDHSLSDEALLTVGVTDVPNGCVVSQPWAYGASTPGVAERLSIGTVCYAMYANPKSGNQGSIIRDGITVGWDLHAGGGWSAADDSAEEILRTYLFRHQALAYCCAFAGLKPTDARPFTGPPDLWVQLPVRDYWAHSR